MITLLVWLVLWLSLALLSFLESLIFGLDPTQSVFLSLVLPTLGCLGLRGFVRLMD